MKMAKRGSKSSDASVVPGDPTVPEDAVVEPHILSENEEEERAARRNEQQEQSPYPIWPNADNPLRQGGESSPAPGKRHH
jgi:hypothetical protein